MPDSGPAHVAEQLLLEAVADRLFPAAVAEVGSSQGALWHTAVGALTFDSDAPQARVDTVFDLASLTKPMATTTVVLDLISQGTLRLDDRITDLCPEWAGDDRRAVTIQDLLEHAGGLSARLLDPPPDHPRAFEHEICAMPLEYVPRTRSIYTDLGFILLGLACERRAHRAFAAQVDSVLGACLDAAANGADHTELFSRVPSSALERTAPTTPMAEDHRRGRRLRGDVHDNYAAALGGLAGHAGLFGTVPGVAAFARVVLRASRGDRTLPRPFTPDLVRRSTTPSTVPGSSRALGWDTMRPTSSCGSTLTASAFGHVGFTGTSLWIDPERDRYYVLLSNRVCEGGTSEQMQVVRRAFHDTLSAL